MKTENVKTSNTFPAHLISVDRVRDVIFRLRSWEEDAYAQADKWECAKGYGVTEREYQRSIHVGIALGLTRAANAIGAELAKHAEGMRMNQIKAETP